MLLEVCIDNFESAISAEAGGAGRIELCSSLLEGGLTPSVGFLKTVKGHIKIPIFVMIRPRGGDFVYSDAEIQIMKEDVKILKQNGADGFVFGILTENGEVNRSHCIQLLSEATPLPCTFHRAFDLVPDPLKSLEDIISLGFQRILTSGQGQTAEDGVELIQRLVIESKERISIMAGSGITPKNIELIMEAAKISEVHASCRKRIGSKMKLENKKGVTMGSGPDEMTIQITDLDCVAAIVQQLKTSHSSRP